MTKNSKTFKVTNINNLTTILIMPAFNREQSKKDAIVIKQRRARTQAKLGMPEFKAKHPSWVRDAQLENPNYTLINKEVKEKCEKKQAQNEKFRTKLHEI